MHRLTQSYGISRCGRHCLDILSRGSVRVTCKFHITSKGKCGDLPTRAAFVHPAPQNRAKTDRKHIGLDARPAPNDVVTILVDCHDDAKRHHEKEYSPYKSAKSGYQNGKVQNFILLFFGSLRVQRFLPLGLRS